MSWQRDGPPLQVGVSPFVFHLSLLLFDGNEVVLDLNWLEFLFMRHDINDLIIFLPISSKRTLIRLAL